MSDAYGTLTINLSSDFTGNIYELCNALNRFGWSSDHELWYTDYQNNLCCLSGNNRILQYPSAFPDYRHSINITNIDLTTQRVNNPSGLEIVKAIKDGDDVLTKSCNLELITRIIAPTIKQGWIEVSSISTWKDYSFRAINLSIDSKHNSKVVILDSGGGGVKGNTEQLEFYWTTPSLEEFTSEGCEQ